jgi:hypothetical protein
LISTELSSLRTAYRGAPSISATIAVKWPAECFELAASRAL